MHLAPNAHRLFLLVLLGATPALAQAPRLTLPDASPHASVSQRVGLTDITIDYHRPAVGKRKIRGGLVPYDEPWRAGANENTTITFSTPVTVGGKQLAAGTYGVHMIPTAKTWTVALSTVSTAWGSFSYDPKEDAVRFTVTPTPAEHEESLEYRFENPTETSTNVVLQWEKLQVSFPDHRRHEGRDRGQPQGPAPRAAEVLLAAVEQRGHVVRQGRLRNGPGAGLGGRVDQGSASLRQPDARRRS